MQVERFGRVAVLMGGRSSEREVSLASGQAVLAALQAAGVDAFAFDPAEQAITDLLTQRVDRVFIVLHGRGGEDGSIQGFLQHAGLPYTGSGVLGSALALDKIRTKHLFCAAGLPTAEYRVARRACWQHEQLEEWLAALGGKIMVKPTNEGSSVGMTIAEDVQQLKRALDKAFDYDDSVLLERWIAGDEYTVAILGQQVLPVVQMKTPRAFYDYQAKYQSDSTEYLCPAPLSPAAAGQLQQLAWQAFELVGASGWGRVDAMRDRQGRFYLLEVNTVPGMTPKSLVPMAARAAGLDFSALVLAILAQTLEADG